MAGNDELDFSSTCKKIVVFLSLMGAHKKQAQTTLMVNNVIFQNDKFVLLPNKTFNIRLKIILWSLFCKTIRKNNGRNV